MDLMSDEIVIGFGFLICRRREKDDLPLLVGIKRGGFNFTPQPKGFNGPGPGPMAYEPTKFGPPLGSKWGSITR